MKGLAVFAVGRRGSALAGRIARQLGGEAFVPRRFLDAVGGPAAPLDEGELRSALADAFGRYRGLVLVMPLGAGVRLVAPHLRDKRVDPAVVAVDEAGTYAIAALSGHLGGGNDLARLVGAAIGAQPILTTAAEVLGGLALDLLGREHGWTIEEGGGLTRAMAALLNGEPVGCYQDAGEEEWWASAPKNLVRYASLDALANADVAARLVVSDRVLPGWHPEEHPRLHQLVGDAGTRSSPRASAGVDAATVETSRSAQDGRAPWIVFRPRTLVLGIGCSRGATADEIGALVDATLREHGLAAASVRGIATIDAKRDEAGLATFAQARRWPIDYFSARELAGHAAPSGASEVVERAVGVGAVCEPAALRATGAAELVVPKRKAARATVAVARAGAERRGHLAVVGIGPGGEEDVTARARRALEEAEAVVGYHGYLDLVRPWLGRKAYHGSPIGDEAERCRLAIDLARRGRRVALVSSGDAGIYGMAGLVFELLEADGRAAEAAQVEVVAGVSAAQAAAALLGAPLMSDFAAVSLSDLMTPWPAIERRLEAAAAADFVVALYNPASARRREQLPRAREILLRHRGSETPVGVVRNAGRPGQDVRLTTLGGLLDEPVDMLTVVVVGNSATIRVGDCMVTRRGYTGGS